MIRQFTIYWYKNIFQNRADISWSLFLFVIFLSEYRSNNSVKRQLATVFVWADENEKKKSLFIFLTHQRDHHHYAMDSTTYLEKYGNLIFFIFQVCQYLDKINPFSKRKSIICFINNTFSNRYCLISSQYAGNVLILQTVF